jgi:hypothetical protein
MPFRFSLGTVIMIPDALVASVVDVSIFSMRHNNLIFAGLNVISCCTWDMRNTYRILVGRCEKIAWKEHMEVDHKEIRCKIIKGTKCSQSQLYVLCAMRCNS